MIVNLDNQVRYDMTIPPPPVKVFTGSSLPLRILGIPDAIAGGNVTALKVTITNADAVSVAADAVKEGIFWIVTFAASNFTNFGKVEKGIRYEATVEFPSETEGEPPTTHIILLAAGILDVRASNPSAEPGDPSKFYQVRGDDEFHKSYKANNIQHFKKVVISYDPDMEDWGFNLEGDYILSSTGEFIPFI